MVSDVDRLLVHLTLEICTSSPQGMSISKPLQCITRDAMIVPLTVLDLGTTGGGLYWCCFSPLLPPSLDALPLLRFHQYWL